MLRDHVVVTSQQGYKAKLREAAVDMKKGNVVSEQPVEIKLPNGTLKANRMEIVDSGDVVRFTAASCSTSRPTRRRRRNERFGLRTSRSPASRSCLAPPSRRAQPAQRISRAARCRASRSIATSR